MFCLLHMFENLDFIKHFKMVETSKTFIIFQLSIWIFIKFKIYELFISRKTYMLSSNERKKIVIIDKILSDVEKKDAFQLGSKDFVLDRHIPKFVISFTNRYVSYSYSHFVGMANHPNITISIYSLRFGNSSKTLNDENLFQCNLKENEINVIENDGYTYNIVEEIIHSKIPQDILNTCNKCADKISEIVKENNFFSQVFILYGSSGAGKTTTTRVLAKKLNALLYSDYNPTNFKDSIPNLYRDLKYAEKPYIIVIEEFDIILKKTVEQNVPTNKEKQAEIQDKMSWNNYFDKIKKRKNFIIIMTTNLSIKDIRGIINNDISFIRKNRVDGFFEFDKNNVVFYEDYTKIC